MRKDQEDAAPGDIMALTVRSHPRFLYIIRSALFPLLIDSGFGKREARRIILAVDEACSNIIKYAYEGDPCRTIGLTVSAADGKLAIRIRDFGKQVDVSKIAPRRLDQVRPGGLGTHFMAEIFDRVAYDTNHEQGTVLILEKSLSRGAGQGR